MTTVNLHRHRALFGASLIALSLAACNKPAPASTAAVVSPPPGAMPLAATGTEPPLAPSALPPAAAVPTAFNRQPRERYRWVDRAQALNSAFANSPPDYTVDYQGSRPWVWRARNGARRVVEHTSDGDRTYYYDPGSDRPYLVRSPQYAYAYDQGQLVAVYDDQGRPIADAEAQARAERAGEYLARARDLYAASQQEQHEAAVLSDWQSRRDAQNAQERAWQAQQQRDADWRAWHDQNATAQAAAYDQERATRAAYAASLGAVAVGAFIAGRDSAPRHDDGGRPRDDYRQGPGVYPPAGFGNQDRGPDRGYDHGQDRGPNRGPDRGPDRGQFHDQQIAQQAAAIALARQQQNQADQARLAQQSAQQNAIAVARQQQAQAVAAGQAQALAQQRGIELARRQQAEVAAAGQAQAQAQQRAVDAARHQQMQADAARQAQVAQQQSAAEAARRAQAQAQSQAAQSQAQAARAQAAAANARQQEQAAAQARAGVEVARHQAEVVAQARQQVQAKQTQAEAAAKAAREQQAKVAAAKLTAPPAPAAKPEATPKNANFHGGQDHRDRAGEHAAQP